MYIKPKLEEFGTFRDLTQLGGRGANDPLAFIGVPGGCTFGVYNVPLCPSASTS